MRKRETLRGSESIGEQITLREVVRIKSDLAVGGSCQVVRVRKQLEGEEWDEVGEEFEVFAGAIRFSAEYDEEDDLHGLIEYWPSRKRWEFYQLDCREE